MARKRSQTLGIRREMEVDAAVQDGEPGFFKASKLDSCAILAERTAEAVGIYGFGTGRLSLATMMSNG